MEQYEIIKIRTANKSGCCAHQEYGNDEAAASFRNVWRKFHELYRDVVWKMVVNVGVGRYLTRR